MTRADQMASVLVVALVLWGFNGDCMKPKTAEIRGHLDRELKVGDSHEKVEEVLTKAGIPYQYDQFQNRYQSTVFDQQCGPYDAISIYVYFDPSGRMSRIEVRETYTAP
jgi:hypothetical protein